MAVYFSRLPHPIAMLIIALDFHPIQYSSHEQVLLNRSTIDFLPAYGASVGGASFDTNLTECVSKLPLTDPQLKYAGSLKIYKQIGQHR